MISTSIRKRRRDRTRNRIANQKRLDAITLEKINRCMISCLETWGGTICPECHKSVPARGFIRGGDIRFTATTILTTGTSVAPQYCHRDVMRCASESAKEDQWKWKLSAMYQEMNK